jgi:hypothetical protein
MYLTATYLANFAPLSLPLRDSGLFGLAKPSSMPFTIALHLSSWIAQFIGHGVFEGRAPALMTSLVQGRSSYETVARVIKGSWMRSEHRQSVYGCHLKMGGH